ncbi:MAG: type II toxin-antitoxin system HigB family toxin [Pseudomonadota bacterium]|jgi:HTH-type transcriptional regulator / antitoxin HigA
MGDIARLALHQDGQAVFNIAGNKYRIVVWINYPCRVVYIRFIGTHRQYGRIDALVTLVEAWEAKHYPIDLPDPVEAIRRHMENQALEPRDLIPYIGSRNRVCEMLNRKRPLTLRMIWRLHRGLGIPAESLIRIPEDQAA